ncbi:MAG TPA: DUF507 family protein [Thermodesulfovibrionia bacterium]|nr:DUF507 family protein [Thermodesulfovibrionia bacterium]
MALHKSRIPILSRAIIEGMQQHGFLIQEAKVDYLQSVVSELFLNELTVEEQLNEEAHQLLAKFGKEIEKEGADYRKLFEMTRKKLAKEKIIVL